jgi:HEAT repeat protein
LENLYREFVELLDFTVFKLIDDIIAHHSPEQVGKQRPNRRLLDSSFVRYGIHNNQNRSRITNFKEAFEEYQGRLLLLGDPGSGKSTTLYAFGRDAVARRLSDPSAPLPIFARIPSWPSNYKDAPQIHDWLAKQFSKYFKESKLKDLLAKNDVLLLLDGLDELGDSRFETVKETDPRNANHTIEQTLRYDPRKRFLSKLEDLPEHVQIVLSCRVKDYATIEGQIDFLSGAVTLQELTDEQIRGYLSTLSELWEVLEKDDVLRQAFRTPLLLSILAFVFRDRSEELKGFTDLSSTTLRDTLFLKYVEARYDYESRREDYVERISLSEILHLLGHLALENIGTRPKWATDWRSVAFISDNVILQKDFKLIFPAETSHEKIDTFCNLLTHLNILQQSANGTYKFIHLLLRDTLAHLFSKDNISNIDLYHNSRKSIDYPNPALSLVRTGGREDVPIWIKLLEISQLPQYARTLALETLGQYRDSRAVPKLCEIVLGSNVEEQLLAVKSLRQIEDQSAVGSLCKALDTDYIDLKIEIIKTLKDLGGEVSQNAIINSLNHWHRSVRYSCALALENFAPEVFRDALITLLLDKDRDNRLTGAVHLSKLGDAKSIEALVKTLLDKDGHIRIKVASILDGLGWKPLDEKEKASYYFALRDWVSLDEVDTPYKTEMLADALSDLDSEIRVNAAQILIFDLLIKDRALRLKAASSLSGNCSGDR